ncbi:MAG TPA: efflux transporter outer membrane subunit [Usitatibacter sp.]|nr:efflux transporter outer membrane subunit [Usitatibacter sp.]
MRLTMLAAALVLSGCVSVPAIDTSRIPAAPANFKEARVGAVQSAAVQPAGEWWKAFNDPVLDDLVARADRGNTGIEVAVARLRQARALARITDADRAPQLTAGAGVSRLGGIVDNTSGPARTFGSVGANLSYEVDLFGKLARASEAARLDARSREELLRGTRLLVQAEVAQVYLALRALDDERALVRGTVSAYRDTLDLTERRYRAGDVAELDVARARTEVAATESDAFALDLRRSQLEHALAVLVGDVSSRFEMPMAQWQTALPAIPPGVPSAVLERRPDVAAAESGMLAAQQRVGVAKAAWFPDLSLTATGGFASTELGDLLKWPSRAWGVSALLAVPIFDGGRRSAGIESANAQLDEALARYREQVLVAFQDVEDQLSALRILADQADAQARAVTAATRSTALSNSRYRNGLVSQLELLDARRSELANRRQALQVRAAQYQATVGLVRALGGGWEGAS